MVRHAVRLAVAFAVFAAGLSAAAPARLNAAGNPLATPATMVRFYFHALDTGQCELASKFAGGNGQSLSAFLRTCRAIRRVTIQRLNDPGYRLRPQNATYTCLAIRYSVDRDSGTQSFGGWYLMERTLGPAWHILFPLSHITRGGSATHLTRAQCASHLPSYVQPSSGTIISGSAFLSATTGWIALSTSGSYAPNGSCSHGIGSNCDAASTTVYRTDDAGKHWSSMLHFTTTTGPSVWIRLFSRRVGLVIATVGPLTPASNQHFNSVLFSTRDGGRHWRRFPLPVNYATQVGTMSFPDPRHGWLWCCGGGAGGSMPIDVYRTLDGGRHWERVACTAFESATSRYACPHPSGIGLAGDKEDLTFKDAHDGWLTAIVATGAPDLYHTPDGGVTWQRQSVGLPPGVALPTAKSNVFPSGTLLQPSFFGRIGLLPEEVDFYRPKSRANWNRLYIFRSTDGGQTWSSALRTPVTAPITLWQAIDSRHWLVVSNEAIWSTANGGVSWAKRRLHFPGDVTRLVSIEMITPATGWATAQAPAGPEVSASGTFLLHTSDGGVHWIEVKLP